MYSISATNSYTVSNIPYSLTAGTGTAVSLSDDAMSAAKAIGFTFNFFGTNYTNFYLCSNGFITFSANNVLFLPGTARPSVPVAFSTPWVVVPAGS